MGKWSLPTATTLLAPILALSIAACAPRVAPTGPAWPSGANEAAPDRTLPVGEPIRAAYFYSYVSLFHLDSLAGAGFNRAIVKFIGDSLDTRGAGELRAWMDRGTRVPLEVVPSWSLQAAARLAALPTTRRYTWGSGTVEPNVGCPLDSLFWRSAMLDRAREILGTTTGIARIALDLEIYTGTPHHYVEPCRCASCRDERGRATDEPVMDDRSRRSFDAPHAPLPGETEWAEARLTTILAGLLSELAALHPGLELGIFDLDRDAFAHRAMARALVQAGVATVDYTERTYSSGASLLPATRSALQALGSPAPIVAGLWLKRWTPAALPAAIGAVLDGAQGWFAFTTFSLWVEPEKRTGAYALQGAPAAYWAAFRAAHAAD